METETVTARPAQIGDTVVCINDSQSFNRLRVGDTYKVVANFDGSPTVMVGQSSHCMERFALQAPRS